MSGGGPGRDRPGRSLRTPDAAGGPPEGDVPHEAYLGALAALPSVGNATLRSLLTLGAPAEVWERVGTDRIPSEIRAALAPAVQAASSGWAAAARSVDPVVQWQRWRARGIGVISIGSPSYPPCLAGDVDPPIVLFHRGDVDVLAAPRVAVIGTRRATGYGRRLALDLGRGLAESGVCVVSGLALGIDAAAHHGAVAAAESQGPAAAAGPAAVVGGGVDAPGPSTNADLARRVVELGVVLSEAPPRTRPAPWRFPVRNRILAALAQVVVVVESAERGGSMVTVEHAQRRDRTILAVPGPVGSPASSGTNDLIADGAGVCRGVDDVLVALGISAAATGPSLGEQRPEPAGDAAAVLGALGFSPTSMEALARDADLDLARLSVALGELERLGWAERRGPFVERVARPGAGPPG